MRFHVQVLLRVKRSGGTDQVRVDTEVDAPNPLVAQDEVIRGVFRDYHFDADNVASVDCKTHCHGEISESSDSGIGALLRTLS